MTIDNNFWCSDTTALDILTERLQHSEQSNHSLYSFFKQRAQIEEDYGKQLLKLSESIIFHDDIECLEILPTTTEVMARAHIELGQNIKHLIEVPLHSFVSEHSILKTKITQQMHESQLTKLLHSDNVKKVEHEYITECKKPIVDVPFVSILDKEYQIAIDIMQINSPSWIDNWRESCRTMQDVEEKRMDYMKSLCISFASMISYTYCIDDQTCDHTLVAVKEFNPKLEMEMFIKEHATGSIPPDIPKYTKYKDSSIHPPTKKITEINIPNKKDEQLRSIDEQLMKLPLTDIRHTTRLYTPQEYPLNPAYKPSKNDAGSNAILSKWYETYRRYSNDTHSK
ncbi:hypothetical protein BDB01DRAFT_812597 [Pilobolus umbonatus]|nr:hypothetical protein BDB01DRAFT_812597 [Pilobolus umbonatus]